MDVINGMFIGAVVGAIIALPAVWSEIFRRGKNLPILIDVRTCWGDRCHDDEVFTLSIFVHLLVSIAVGGFYVTAVFLGWLQDFSLVSIFTYQVFVYLFSAIVALPLVKLGFFGWREGKFMWIELLITNVLFAFGYWLAFKLFPVFLP